MPTLLIPREMIGSGTTATNAFARYDGAWATVGGGGGGGVAVSAGSQEASAGTISFANSNGVTWGMSNSSQITASVALTGNGYAHGGTAGASSSSTYDLSAMSFAGAGHDPSIEPRNQEYRVFAMNYYTNAMRDLHVSITKR